MSLPHTRQKGTWYRLREAFRSYLLGRSLQIAVIIVFTISIVLPIIFMAATSVKEPIEIRESGSLLPSKGVFLINWQRAYRNVPLYMYLFNSTVVAVLSTVIALAVAVPATYAIVRFRVGGKVLPSMILGTYVMPPIVVSIPFFTLMRIAGLVNSRLGLIIVHGMINAPVAIWLLDSFVRAIPKELEEAAWVDGYSRFDTLRRVVIPLIRPALVSAGIICLILSWNEFLFALILTYSDISHTFPVGISRYEGEHGLQFGEMSAAALTGIVPIYVLVLLFQQYLVRGLTRGGVKG